MSCPIGIMNKTTPSKSAESIIKDVGYYRAEFDIKSKYLNG